MAIDDIIQEHEAYIKAQEAPKSGSGISDIIAEHQNAYPESYATKPASTAWYDQPVDKTGTVPMVDEYGRVIPGSEGMSTASMSPRQLALLGLTAASVPLTAAAGTGAGALYAGSRVLPYAARMATSALLGGTSGAIAGEDTGGIAASSILGGLAPAVGSALSPLANNRLLTAVSPAQWLLKGGAYGAKHLNMPQVAHALEWISHYVPSLPVAANLLARTGQVVSNPAAPAYVPAVNSLVGASP